MTRQNGSWPPGSFGWPIIGETISYAKNSHRFFESRYEKYGPVFKTKILGDRVVCFVGADAFDFFVESPYFNREGANPRHVRELLSWHSLPLIAGTNHLRLKQGVLQAFRPRALEIYDSTVQRVTHQYLERWESLGEFAWVPEYKKLSASICNELLLGGDPEINIDDLVETLDRFMAGLTALPIKFPWTVYGRALRSRDRLISRIDQAIQEHRQRPFQDMLGELLQAESEDGSRLDEEQIRAQMVHMFFAAYGGIYRSLTLLSLSLAQYPAVMERARREVLREAPDGPLELERLGRLVYLDQVTKEVRRYHRVFASTFFDRVSQPFQYREFHVPEGWKAVGGIYTTMQDTNVFSQPDLFDPDRFGPGRGEDQRHKNSYVPQGGGPEAGHRCPAEDLTTVLLKAVGALLLRQYTWELPPQDLRLDNKSSPLPRDGLKVRFTRHARSTGP